MAYTQFGPFSNGGAPGLSASFFNPLETFLLSLNTASYDSHISSDGNGNITALGTIQFSASSAQLKISNGGSILDATGATDLILNAPNTGGGHKLKWQVGGVTVASIDSSGNILYKGAAPAQNNNP
jgi:hypothetical protein